jgi:hypothetical protein
MMHLPVNVKSPNNISKWLMGFNSAFKGLRTAAVKELVEVALAVKPYKQILQQKEFSLAG